MWLLYLILFYFCCDRRFATLAAEADAIGYPVMIKAVLGGGGKGMRIVHQRDELQARAEGSAPPPRETVGPTRPDAEAAEQLAASEAAAHAT